LLPIQFLVWKIELLAANGAVLTKPASACIVGHTDTIYPCCNGATQILLTHNVVSSSQFPILKFSGMLFGNVGSFSLDCKISAAGHARSGLLAAGDGLCCAAGRYALHAPPGVRAFTAAGDAMSSFDVRAKGAAVRIVQSWILRSLVSSQRR